MYKLIISQIILQLFLNYDHINNNNQMESIL